MEIGRSPWSSPRQSRRRYDRHTTPSPDLKKIMMKIQSSDRDRSTSSEHGSREHGKRQYHTDRVRHRKLDAHISHQEHRLSRTDSKKLEDLRTTVDRPMYRSCINRGDLVGRAQENTDQGNVDARK
jgi:hypothetical protein